MIYGLKPYPAYKDSGVPWLGQVPEHWEVRRTKTILRERSEKGHPNEPLLAATQTKGVVRKERYENRTVLALKDLHVLKLVEAGDFVISLRSFQGGIEYARERGIISPAYTILYPNDAQVHPYLAFLFKSTPYIENLQLFVTGIRQGQNIDYEKLSRSSLLLPPLPEQTAIVRFLDLTERRIRRAIRAWQRRMKLLEEYKQALIHQAVTGQIDVRTGKPYPAYKDSDVEWLGDVPAHWDVVPLCGLGRPKKVTNCVDRELLSVYLHRGVIRFSDVPDKRTNPTSEDLSKYQVVDYGDFVLNNQQAWRGSVGVSKYSGIVSPAYLVLALNGRLDTTYADRLLQDRSMVDQYLICSKGVGSIQRNLYWPHLRRVAVPVPPNTEQTAIVQYLDAQTTKIDAAIAAARREIELLREYRTRLISDVVTGKADVREVAARLPEEPPEDEEAIMEDEGTNEDGEATDDDTAAEIFSEEEAEP